MAAAEAEPAIDQDLPEQDLRQGSSVSGMSGLSDLMQAEPNAKAGDTAVGGQAPPIREAKFASTEKAQHLAKSAAHLRQTQRPAAMSQQSRRMAILVIALLALGVALAGIGLVLLGGDEPRPTGPRDNDSDTGDQERYDPSFDPAGPPRQPDVDEPGMSQRDDGHDVAQRRMPQPIAWWPTVAHHAPGGVG